jgi:hypothetical protein
MWLYSIQSSFFQTIIATGHFTAMDNGQVLDLQFKGKQFTVDANKNESLGKLKEKIKAAEKIPTKQQVLNYKNTVLKDDKKTMDGLGIKVKCLGWGK